MRFDVLRLRPGDDLKETLLDYVENHNVSAGFIATGMGSLTRACLRYPNQHGADYTVSEGEFEIVALTGTLGPGREDGSHLHIALTRDDGSSFGGHLQSGSLVCTTAEIVLGILDELVFSREPDSESGFDELVIRPKQ